MALIMPISRNLIRTILNIMNIWARPTVVFGSGENAYQACLAIQSEPSIGFNVKGMISPDLENQSLERLKNVISFPWPETQENFKTLRNYHCVIALEANQNELRDKLIRKLSENQIQNIHVIPAMRGVPLFGLGTTQFFSHEVLMIHVCNRLANPLLRIVKRSFDIIGSISLISLLLPLLVYISYKVSRDGGSAFFGHERIGENGKPFKCYKFRSMVTDAQEVLERLLANDPIAKAEWNKDFKLKNDPRINKIGHFLRRTSLDELPQLWNVLKGEMSLVGPRPVVKDELERYGDDVVYYLTAKPGMTGLWQVSGRNDVDYETRVYFDVWYVKNWSLWSDIAILFKTITVVTNRTGAY